MSRTKPAPTFKPGQANAYRAIVSTVSFGKKVESVAGLVYSYADTREEADAYALRNAQMIYGGIYGLKFERVELT